MSFQQSPAESSSKVGVAVSVEPQHEMAIEPIHVSVKDAARILGISPHHCDRLLNAADSPIDSRYLGKRRLVVLTSLREYAANLPTTRPDVTA